MRDRKVSGEDMTKDEARALIREKKKTLTAEYRAQANAEIATRFLCYPIFQRVSRRIVMAGDSAMGRATMTASCRGRRCIPTVSATGR